MSKYVPRKKRRGNHAVNCEIQGLDNNEAVMNPPMLRSSTFQTHSVGTFVTACDFAKYFRPEISSIQESNIRQGSDRAGRRLDDEGQRLDGEGDGSGQGSDGCGEEVDDSVQG